MSNIEPGESFGNAPRLPSKGIRAGGIRIDDRIAQIPAIFPKDEVWEVWEPD